MNDDELREALRVLRQEFRESKQELDGLATAVTRLVKQLEQEEHLRARLERAEEQERDERHERLFAALEQLRQRVDAMSTFVQRDLPEVVLRILDRQERINEWGAASASHSGMTPVPGYGPPTIPAIPAAPRRDPTPPVIMLPLPQEESAALTVGQQRKLKDLFMGVIRRWPYFLAAAGGAAIKWFHQLIEAARHLGH